MAKWELKKCINSEDEMRRMIATCYHLDSEVRWLRDRPSEVLPILQDVIKRAIRANKHHQKLNKVLAVANTMMDGNCGGNRLIEDKGATMPRTDSYEDIEVLEQAPDIVWNNYILVPLGRGWRARWMTMGRFYSALRVALRISRGSDVVEYDFPDTSAIGAVYKPIKASKYITGVLGDAALDAVLAAETSKRTALMHLKTADANHIAIARKSVRAKRGPKYVPIEDRTLEGREGEQVYMTAKLRPRTGRGNNCGVGQEVVAMSSYKKAVKYACEFLKVGEVHHMSGTGRARGVHLNNAAMHVRSGGETGRLWVKDACALLDHLLHVEVPGQWHKLVGGKFPVFVATVCTDLVNVQYGDTTSTGGSCAYFIYVGDGAKDTPPELTYKEI